MTDFSGAIKKATNYVQAGEFRQAQAVLEPILQTTPSDKTALHLSGIAAFQLGEFEAARNCFARLVAAAPDNAVALNNLGLAQQELGMWADALVSHRRAASLAPNLADTHYNLGIVLQQCQELSAADIAYSAALKLDPQHPGSLLNSGSVNQMLGHVNRAVEIYRQAIQFHPCNVQLLVNLGKVLIELEDLEQAKANLRKANDIDDENAEAACHLGRVYRRQGEISQALYWGKQAVALDPGSADCHKFLGLTLKEAGDLSSALEQFESALLILRTPTSVHPHGLFTFSQTTRSKLSHDIEQLQLLLARNRIVDNTYLNELIRMRHQLGSGPGGKIETIPLAASAAVAGVYNRLVYRRQSKTAWNEALNPHIDHKEIERDYRQRAPGIVYFDGLLSTQALDELYQFCLESTIWYDFRHSNGYLGAYMEEGFHSPLLMRIAQQLCVGLPGIFAGHRLLQLWAYKYDSHLSGIEMHADFAAINVNFWITPDSANRNSESGGMVIWDKVAPSDWPFERYNSSLPEDQRAISDFLRASGAKQVKIPYRQNRVVIFNSDLFHRTDVIEFEPGYENRRINVTMLFGKRQH